MRKADINHFSECGIETLLSISFLINYLLNINYHIIIMHPFVSLKNLYVHFPTFRISYFFSVFILSFG